MLLACMRFIRPAGVEEVLAATPQDEPTRDVVRTRTQFGVWSLNGQDLGAKLPDGKMGTTSALFAEWRAWLGSADPRAPSTAERRSAFLHLLRERESFRVRPIILGPKMQIHDVRHRLFAAFEHLTEHEGDEYFEVFWDRVG
jgi:hypothetical protein